MAVDIAEIAIFVALMVAGAYIKIPFPLVPLTFQTVFCVLSGLMLGWKKGTISMAVYCFMGLIGIPVFASGGGISYVVNPTFGYILGFILASFVAGILTNKPDLPYWRYCVAAIAAFLANYLIGIPYVMVVEYILEADDLFNIFVTWNLYYMPKDLVLCILASVLAWKVVPLIRKGKSKIAQPAERPAQPAEEPAQPAEEPLQPAGESADTESE